jgi:DNA-binding transcriptional LysR family regulator
MPLSLRHVEVFHAIMTFGSVTRAAEFLRTSQPTVSRELKALEDQLGFKLFERRGRSLSASPKAILLHTEVKRSFVGLAEVELAARSIRENAARSFQIACMPLFAQTLMPRICDRFIRLVPDGRLTFDTADHSVLPKELLTPRYDFALLEAGIRIEGIVTYEIPVGHEVCVLPAGHRLCQKDVVEPMDLHNERAVTLRADDAYRRRYERMFEGTGIGWKVCVETGTADAMCALVREGVGIAIVNPITARARQGPDLHVRPLAVSIPFVVAVCCPPGRPHSESYDILLEIILEECRAGGLIATTTQS